MATLTISNTFVAGTDALASEVNQNFTDVRTFVNSQVVHRDGTTAFTSTPSMPSTAAAVTAAGHVSNKAYVDDRRWNTAWGVMQQVTFTSPQTFSTTGTVLMTGSTLPSFTFLAGRRYLLRAFIPAVQVSGTSFVAGLNITNAAGAQWARHEVSVRSATESWAFTPVYLIAPLNNFTGQYELRGFCSAGSSSWETDVGAFQPGIFTLEDVGPA